MANCQGDEACNLTPMELYEKLNLQGDQVRALKTEKAAKVTTVFTLMQVFSNV